MAMDLTTDQSNRPRIGPDHFVHRYLILKTVEETLREHPNKLSDTEGQMFQEAYTVMQRLWEGITWEQMRGIVTLDPNAELEWERVLAFVGGSEFCASRGR